MKLQTNPPIFYWKHRVYFGDTDAAGIVYHGRYIYWMESARIEWLDHLQYPYTRFINNKTSLVPTKLEIQYKAPLTFNEHFSIKIQIESLSFASITLKSTFETNYKIHAIGIVKLGMIDDKKWKPCKLPKDFLEVLQGLQ